MYKILFYKHFFCFTATRLFSCRRIFYKFYCSYAYLIKSVRRYSMLP